MTEVLARLSALGISYELIEHPPAATMADCKLAEELLGGVMPKNLFLTPRNMSAFHLVILMPDAEFRTSDVSKQLGSARLSFGPTGKLAELLHTYPGAISPLGLMFPSAGPVRLAMDSRLRACDKLLFHPCDNRATVGMAGRDFFEVFLPAVGHEAAFLDIAAHGG